MRKVSFLKIRRLFYGILIIVGSLLGLGNTSSAGKFIQKDVENAGDALQFIVPTFVFGRVLYEPNGGDSVSQFVKHFLFIHGVTYLGKILVNEMRPSGSNLDSFPSGHTAAAFSGATFVHFRYSFDEAKYLYLLSAFTAFSRVYAEKHHVHDVLASVALSFVSSYIFVTRKNDRVICAVNFDPSSRRFSLALNFLLE
ncbi:MAG: phosphatase PAP2 family protein [Rickettsiales bacterium]|jgi:membrane-associated phospholipid phosphatase|nr:phosphatase PAP2 family protein [Rickettsiales bacterium]